MAEPMPEPQPESADQFAKAILNGSNAISGGHEIVDPGAELDQYGWGV